LSKIFFGLKILVSLALLTWLVRVASDTGAFSLIASADLGWLFLAFVLHALVYMGSFFRWHLALDIFYPAVTLPLAKGYMIGVFSNNFLPGNLGGDLVRCMYLYRLGLSASKLFLAVLLDRLAGLYLIFILAFIGLKFFPTHWVALNFDWELTLNTFILALIIPPVFLLLVKRYGKGLDVQLSRYVWLGTYRRLQWVVGTCLNRPGNICSILLLSGLSACGIGVCYSFLAESLGAHLSASVWLILVPFSFVVSALPISFGGAGVREGAVVFLLMLSGVEQSISVAISLLYLSVLVILSVPGGILLLMGRSEGADTPL